MPEAMPVTQFVGALSASIGVGMGVLALLVFNVFEASLWDISGFGSVSFTLPPDQVPYLAVFLAAFLGVYFGHTLATDETTTYLVAALSSAVGVVAVLVSSAVLTSLVVILVAVNSLRYVPPRVAQFFSFLQPPVSVTSRCDSATS